jgi:hypothetical protein
VFDHEAAAGSSRFRPPPAAPKRRHSRTHKSPVCHWCPRRYGLWRLADDRRKAQGAFRLLY